MNGKTKLERCLICKANRFKYAEKNDDDIINEIIKLRKETSEHLKKEEISTKIAYYVLEKTMVAFIEYVKHLKQNGILNEMPDIPNITTVKDKYIFKKVLITDDKKQYAKCHTLKEV